MKRLLTWAARGLAATVVVAMCLALGALAASEVMLKRTYPKQPLQLVAARDAGAVARGARLARIYGCHDCHGETLAGRLFFDEMPLARMSGPNLSKVLVHQSDGEIAQAIRAGVAADGRGLWIMPSQAFAHLSDAETADLIAYLRTARPTGDPHAVRQVGVVGRMGLLLGQFRSAPQMLKAEAHVAPVDLGPQYAQGRSLSRACMECHGSDLKGSALAHAPDLAIAGAYEPEDFERLLRTGVAAGNRRLGLMSEAAPGRFNAFSHEEIAALHAYLKARAERAS